MKEVLFFVGTYAEPNDNGIFLYKADFENRKFTRLAAHAGTPNPSYLLQNSNGLLYAVEELAAGGNISAYSLGPAGFHKQCTLSSNGADPCHLAMDDQERFLFVSNYSSGSLSMFELDSDGMPQAIREFVQHTGTGVHPVRQTEPHVHFSQYRDGLLYVNDLGLDTVFCYRLDAEKKTLEKTDLNIRLPGGSGPRHLCFHPVDKGWLYVIAELTAHVFVYHLEQGRYILKQEIGSLPENASKENISAAIKFSDNGDYLFVSNRGSDTLTAFSVTEERLLRLLDVCETGGKAPRDFTPFDDHIIVANQDSSILTVLRFDRISNRLERLDMQEKVERPVCILKTEMSLPIL